MNSLSVGVSFGASLVNSLSKLLTSLRLFCKLKIRGLLDFNMENDSAIVCLKVIDIYIYWTLACNRQFIDPWGFYAADGFFYSYTDRIPRIKMSRLENIASIDINCISQTTTVPLWEITHCAYLQEFVLLNYPIYSLHIHSKWLELIQCTCINFNLSWKIIWHSQLLCPIWM